MEVRPPVHLSKDYRPLKKTCRRRGRGAAGRGGQGRAGRAEQFRVDVQEEVVGQRLAVVLLLAAAAAQIPASRSPRNSDYGRHVAPSGVSGC